MGAKIFVVAALIAAAIPLPAQSAAGQGPLPGVKTGGSSNVRVLAHIPIAGFISFGDLEIEQELSRPYAYVGLARPVTHQAGFVIVGLKDPARAAILYQWVIENSEVHAGVGGFDGN